MKPYRCLMLLLMLFATGEFCRAQSTSGIPQTGRKKVADSAHAHKKTPPKAVVKNSPAKPPVKKAAFDKGHPAGGGAGRLKKMDAPKPQKTKHKGQNAPPVDINHKKKPTPQPAAPKKDTVATLPAEGDLPPALWNISLKKLGVNKYQLVFHLDLRRGWHVFVKSATQGKPFTGPTFIFDKNKDVQLVGETEAKGIRSTRKIGEAMADVYDYKVLYEQELTAPKGAVISGKYTYQLCNDEMAAAPVTKSFRFEVR